MLRFSRCSVLYDEARWQIDCLDKTGAVPLKAIPEYVEPVRSLADEVTIGSPFAFSLASSNSTPRNCVAALYRSQSSAMEPCYLHLDRLFAALRRLILDSLLPPPLAHQPLHPFPALEPLPSIPLLLLTPTPPLPRDLPPNRPSRPGHLFPLPAFLRVPREPNSGDPSCFTAFRVGGGRRVDRFEECRGVDGRGDR